MRTFLSRSVPGMAVLLAILFGLAESQSIGADKKTYYSGQLVSYDPERKLLHVVNGREPVTLVAEPDVKLTIDSLPTTKKLADVPVNAYLVVLLNADQTAGVEINAQGPLVKRTIQDIDLESGSLRATDDKVSQTVTFKKDVRVLNKEEKPTTLDEVKPGCVVHMKLSLDQSKALTIRVIAKPKS